MNSHCDKSSSESPKETNELGGLSRRGFLTGAAAGIIGIGATGLVTACTPKSGNGNAHEPDVKDDVDSKQETLTPTKTEDFDVVVVGGGAGGLSASIQAAQLGANVVLLEKETATGGSSQFTQGLYATNSHFQQELGLDYTPSSVLQLVMTYHQWMADAGLTEHFFTESSATVDWLEALGVKFMGAETLGPSLQVWHTYEGLGTQFMASLLEAANKAGVDIRLSTPGKQLVAADGRIAGIIAEEPDGTIAQFNAAKGVILCSGGYSTSADMVNKYTMFKFDDMAPLGSPNRNGDGILMALDQGAATHVLGTLMSCGGSIKGMSLTSHLNIAASRQPSLWINENGERFANEGIVTDFSCTGNAMALQQAVFSVMDADYVKQISTVGCYYGFGTFIRPGDPLTEFNDDWDSLAKNNNPDIFKADTLDELASAMGVEAPAFKATIETYNEYCRAGQDKDYGKVADHLQPVQTAPFYAFKLAKASFCSVGGLKVNNDSQVINTDGNPIIGLYAVGCDAGGLQGATYDVSIAAGSQQGWAVNGGRFAAKHAMNK